MASPTQTRSEALSCAIAIMRNAIDLLEMKTTTSMPLEEAETQLKAFHRHILIGMIGVVNSTGGESLHIPDPDYLSDDIETAFQMAMIEEDMSAPNYARVYSTLNHAQQGI